jgi:hypothetical protein
VISVETRSSVVAAKFAAAVGCGFDLHCERSEHYRTGSLRSRWMGREAPENTWFISAR